jgi:hypothetical protein
MNEVVVCMSPVDDQVYDFEPPVFSSYWHPTETGIQQEYKEIAINDAARDMHLKAG